MQIKRIQRTDRFVVHGSAEDLEHFVQKAKEECSHAGETEAGKTVAYVKWKTRIKDDCHTCIEVSWTSEREHEELFLAITGREKTEDDALPAQRKSYAPKRGRRKKSRRTKK